ncbi:MAG TPA: hypothetical protein P5181_01175 [Dermatophilaceae bacterium]|nr:hypothetical protein [Dermatophilaceae bacterium]
MGTDTAADRHQAMVPGEPEAAAASAPVRVLVGHYGSGKTEVAVSLAMRLAAAGHRVALGDLDVVNPYFRSRERAEVLTAAGIEVISSTLGHSITQDLPAISPELHRPLADPGCEVLLDVGGNDIGTRALVEFLPDLRRRAAQVLLVVNAYRPDTADLSGVLRHLRAIEDTCGLAVTGLVSNTHVCRETTTVDVRAGYRLTAEVRDATGIPIAYVCGIPEALAGLEPNLDGELIPVGLYLRDPWM